eukprot:CAMPEP_0172726592 /NCGR_PEP_ID=MMETSP1074-20121228/91110_1 /TAXON_ID=2916 /ORGANISM="Ceratium fusus, Strain PA161109" /LENGTH=73 /DNA_ID=CAMNT_0013553661 /DNA_START=129 /DNA_END=350 /DNA_ORIENTATION=+
MRVVTQGREPQLEHQQQQQQQQQRQHQRHAGASWPTAREGNHARRRFRASPTRIAAASGRKTSSSSCSGRPLV